MTSSSKAPGLGERQDVSTRPTREERRREVERVQAAAPGDETTDVAQEASQAALTKIAPRRKPSKVPFNTYLTVTTQRRIEWLKGRGYAVTDIAEEAMRAFLDQAGVPTDDSAS